MRAHWMIIAALFASGCSALFNVDGYEVAPDRQNGGDAGLADAGNTSDSGLPDAGPTDAGASDSGTDSGPSCPPTHRCVPQPEPPWMGPSEAIEFGRSCGGLAPTHLMDLHGSLQVPTASCDCSCTGTPTVTCGDGIRVVGYHADNCTNEAGYDGLLPNQCYSHTLSASLSLEYWKRPSASCARGTVRESIPEATWAQSVRLCEGTARQGACGDPSQACVPSPSSGTTRLCVVAPGELPCPSGFDVGTLMYTGIDDTRACPPTCPCGADGVRCSVVVDRYLSSTSCQGESTSTVRVNAGAAPACLGNTSVIRSIRPRNYTVTDPGFCAPREQPTITGEARPVGAHTVCCTE